MNRYIIRAVAAIMLLSLSYAIKAQHVVESHSITCHGDSDGELTFVPAEDKDVTDYTYSWRLGTTVIGDKYTLKSLSAGTYTLVYTIGGVSGTINFTISEPDELIVNPVASSNNYWSNTLDACTGSIEVNASGGTQPYSYKVYDETSRKTMTTSSINNIPPGMYGITVVDAKGCKLSTRVEVQDAMSAGETVAGSQTGDTTYVCYKEVTGHNVNPSTSNIYPVGVQFDNQEPHVAYYYVLTQAKMNSVAGYDTDTIFIVKGNDTIPYFKTVICDNVTAPTIVLYRGRSLVSQTEDKPLVVTGQLGDMTAFEPVEDIDGNTYTALLGTSSSLSQDHLWPGFHTLFYWTGDNHGVRKGWDIIAPPNPVTINFTNSVNRCYGGNTAAITATAQGSWHDYGENEKFTMSIRGGSHNQSKTANKVISISANGLYSGLYTITATDIHGCSRTQTVNIAQPDYPMSILFSTNSESLNVTDFNQNDCPCRVSGVVDSTFAGGSVSAVVLEAAEGEKTYKWSLVAPDSDTTLVVGDDKISYRIDKTTYGGDTVKFVTINGEEYTNPDSTTAKTMNNNAMIAYNNQLKGQSMKDNMSNLRVGLYALTVTDANKCTVSDTAVIKRDEKSETAKDNSQDCIYNIVTPNGDGLNDVFDLTDISCGFKMKCNIFDVNGRKVGTVTKDDIDNYSGQYAWDPLKDSLQPVTGQTSTYTAFIHLYNDGGTVADYAQSFSVIYYK